MTGTLIVPVVDEGLGELGIPGGPVRRAGHPAVAVLTGGPPDWAEATGGRLE